VLSDDELCKIWTSLPRLPASYATIVKLLILTGQRRGEIAALQSSWIHGNKITLPKEITKNKRAHSFPISTLGQSLLKEISTFTDWSRAKISLDNASGVKNWTLHDLRRTFASNLAALGVRLEVIEKLLNHQSGSFAGVVGIYQRYDFFPEMVAAVQLWEDRLKSIVR
jgi:integrase